MEEMSLKHKIEYIMDDLFTIINAQRQEVKLEILDLDESDSDY
jgi:hypothetical protein